MSLLSRLKRKLRPAEKLEGRLTGGSRSVLWSVGAVTSILSISFSLNAYAVDYYVATNGDDRNEGTSNTQPLSTLAKAAQKATRPGDRVLVKGGTYAVNTAIGLWSNGERDKYITFMPLNNEKVILDGQSSTDPNPDIFTVGGSYYEIKGFEIINAKRIAVNLWGGRHVRVLNNIFHDNQMSCVASWTPPGRPDLTPDDVVIDGNVMYHNEKSNQNFKWRHYGGWNSIVSLGGRNHVVTNNHIYENWGEGIGFYGENQYAARNTLHDNYSVEIYVNNVKNSVVEQNFIYSTGKQQHFRPLPVEGGVFGPSIGIEIANENGSDPVKIDNVQILNNIVMGTRHGIYHWRSSGGGLLNTLIAHNTVVSPVESLLHLENERHSGLRIVNNLFYKGSAQRMTDVYDGASGYTAQNNLWYGGAPHSSLVSPGDVSGDPQLVLKSTDTYLPENYRIGSASPARDRGIALSEVNDDFFQGGRPNGQGTDIGAHEFSGGVSPTPTTTPTAIPTASPISTATPVPTRTPTATSVSTATPSPVPTRRPATATPTGVAVVPTATPRVTATPAEKPDLISSSIKFNPVGRRRKDGSLHGSLAIRLKNQGRGALRSQFITISIYAGGSGQSQELLNRFQTRRVNLRAGGSVSVVSPRLVLARGVTALKAVLDEDGRVHESNEENNSRSLALALGRWRRK